MAKEPQPESRFEALIQKINQETNSMRRKVEILFTSRGFFSAAQATRVLQVIAAPSDKLKAIRIMEPRLCRMSCADACSVLGTLSVHNDKLSALDCLKRQLSAADNLKAVKYILANKALVDCNTRLGREFILSAFPYENDKIKAVRILETVQYDVADQLAAGGHQGYAAVGGLFTQCRPLEPHLYGPVSEQLKRAPGQGEIKVPPTAKPGVVPSMYTGHPSYAYPREKSYAEERGYPTTQGYQSETTEVTASYPAGAPPLSLKATGAPAPTGWPGLDTGAPGFQNNPETSFIQTSNLGEARQTYEIPLTTNDLSSHQRTVIQY